MFKVVWAVAFIMNGIPHTGSMEDLADSMEQDDCEGYIAERQERMADWVRGGISATLDFPVYVIGKCDPVKQDI